MRTEIAAAMLALLLAAPPVAAGEAVDRLFAPGALAGVAAGTTLSYTRERRVPDGAELEPIADATVTVEIENDRAAVSFDRDGRPAGFAHPLAAAHPVLLLFLETAHKSVARLTGGSPFYIKNRFVESFAAAEVEPVATPEGQGERLLVRPFDGDPNVARMGTLAGLEIAFVLSEAVPGGLYSASAAAGGYAESLTFTAGKEK